MSFATARHTKHFSRDKIMFVASRGLSRQALLSRRKACFVHVFVVTKLLSRQKLYLWQLPPMIQKWRQLLSRQIFVFCSDKNILSRQNYVCRNKTFVATSILLSRQKKVFCMFVTTKMILVAPPADDTRH